MMRVWLPRCATAWCLAPIALVLAGMAHAAAPFVVADVQTGRVIASQDATMPWHPASVTKLMTAYVALRQLEAGRIGMETPIPVSRRAASVAPSKIGAKPGQEVTLENALRMMLVKSANDMAVVIAEGVGGSVENFADMMNAEAGRIGMRESHFVNPNGLFAEGQQSSARDMAVLARALLLEFPRQRDLFSIGAVQLGARVMKNTNGLVGRYPGIEGMKTGFICASGFNLVAVASRNGQRLVAVVFGTSSGAERTIRAAELLDRGFSGGGFSMFGGGSSSLDALPPSSVATAPNMREEICVRRKGPPPSEEEPVDLPMAFVSATAEDTRYPTLGTPAPGSVRGPTRRGLGPRAEFAPLIVTLGRTAGSNAAPVAANIPGAGVAVAARAPDRMAPAGEQAAIGRGAVPADRPRPGAIQANPWMGKDVAPVVAAPAAAKPASNARVAGSKAAGKPKPGVTGAAVAKTGTTTNKTTGKTTGEPAIAAADAKAKAASKSASKATAKTASKAASKTTSKSAAKPAGAAPQAAEAAPAAPAPTPALRGPLPFPNAATLPMPTGQLQ